MNPDVPKESPLLSVRDLEVEIGKPRVQAVSGVSFQVYPGEILGLAGESGSGKSVTALSLTRLLPPRAAPAWRGEVHLKGQSGNLLSLSSGALRRIRGRQIGYIFQEPSSSFNPLFSIGAHLTEILRLNRVPAKERSAAMEKALSEVGIAADRETLRAYPGDFSGGMLQRAAVACALLGSPQLLVADEPTTALDTSTQKRVVDLLAEINRQRGMAVLFISHDLALLKQIASRILVMHEGRIVEEGPSDTLLQNPAHPYTRRLVEAIPKLRLPQ